MRMSCCVLDFSLILVDYFTSWYSFDLWALVYSLHFFLYQLGYTKKQEERHFRGVITLEVCITFSFILCVIYSMRLVYGYIIFALQLQRFPPVD
jgi:hypothetical protein